MTLHTSRFHALALAALLSMIVSCEGENPSHAPASNGKGKVILSLYSDLEIRSESSLVSDVDDYNFRFVGVDGYATSEYYRYGDVSWPMEWYFGLFRLEAESCTEEEAETGYGRLRYAGIGQPFSVINDRTATASVVCSIANFRVSVNFSDKMFLAYKDFKLVIDSVLSPIYEEDEDGNMVLVRDEQTLRTLDFTTIDKVGFYNSSGETTILRYTLYVMLDGAEEFIEIKSGYIMEEAAPVPAVVKAGDAIAIKVEYVGDVQPSPGIKFIVSGERKELDDCLELGDYSQGTVTEDE